ncbi:MAG: hypothetical protein JW862_07180 [Anaerolineales bacterium]|nr:hypothetical protein [Anaerolineales bacterium]
MSRKVALVSCVSEKRTVPSPARDLYTSDWFTKAARYASQITDEWYILSAKYGLVHPDQVLEPYNATLKTMGKSARQAWAALVFASLKPHLSPGDTVVFLAGQIYREFLLPLVTHLGCKVEIPMEGLRIGEQLRWLNQHLKGG